MLEVWPPGGLGEGEEARTVNYSDEPYVRLYVTDTVTWELFSWEARTVLLHMLKGRFDRAGVFVTGCHTPSRAVTARTKLPADVVERGLKELLDTETWELGDGCIIWPNYIEAQHARRSDAARKREERERRQLVRRSCHTESQPVTRGHASSHTESHDVTTCHSEAEAEAVTDPGTPPVVPPKGGTTKRPRKQPARPMPADWQPDTGHGTLAASLGLDVSAQCSAYRDHALQSGRLLVDWNAGFRNWLRKAAEMRGGGARASPQLRMGQQPAHGVTGYEKARIVE